MYICDIDSGAVYKIARAGLPTTDCNGNGRSDACDIRGGSSQDANVNGIPDECEGHLGDVTGDGHVDINDLAALLASYGACVGQPGYNPAANFDGDSCVSLSDLAILLAHFGS